MKKSQNASTQKQFQACNMLTSMPVCPIKVKTNPHNNKESYINQYRILSGTRFDSAGNALGENTQLLPAEEREKVANMPDQEFDVSEGISADMLGQLAPNSGGGSKNNQKEDIIEGVVGDWVYKLAVHWHERWDKKSQSAQYSFFPDSIGKDVGGITTPVKSPASVAGNAWWDCLKSFKDREKALKNELGNTPQKYKEIRQILNNEYDMSSIMAILKFKSQWDTYAIQVLPVVIDGVNLSSYLAKGMPAHLWLLPSYMATGLINKMSKPMDEKQELSIQNSQFGVDVVSCQDGCMVELQRNSTAYVFSTRGTKFPLDYNVITNPQYNLWRPWDHVFPLTSDIQGMVDGLIQVTSLPAVAFALADTEFEQYVPDLSAASKFNCEPLGSPSVSMAGADQQANPSLQLPPGMQMNASQEASNTMPPQGMAQQPPQGMAQQPPQGMAQQPSQTNVHGHAHPQTAPNDVVPAALQQQAATNNNQQPQANPSAPLPEGPPISVDPAVVAGTMTPEQTAHDELSPTTPPTQGGQQGSDVQMNPLNSAMKTRMQEAMNQMAPNNQTPSSEQ